MKVYGKWTVTLPDEQHVWDPDNWLGSVWNQVETDLGVTFKQFVRDVDERQFRACQWLIWYLRRQDGKEEDRLGVDFHLVQLRMERIPDPEAEAATTPPSETNTSSVSPSEG